MSDESLITAVSECPVLYDLTLKAYHDQTTRNQATINAVWTHTLLRATTTGAGGSYATSAATARSAINLLFIF